MKKLVALAIVMVLGAIGFWVGIGYIVVHFVKKFW
jgi:hypothetical protein